jgi:hypothetical protein
MMKAIRIGLVAVATLGAWACGEDPAEEYVEERSPEVPAPGGSGTEIAPAGAEAGAGGADYLVRMVGLGGAQLSGTAALQPMQGQTQVTVALVGAEGAHQGHVHEGDTCEQIGAVKWPLQQIDAAAGSEAQSVTMLSVPLDSVMNGNTLVVFHQPGGQQAICGDIPVLPPNLPA